MKKSTLIVSYTIFVSVLIVLFHAAMQELILSTIMKIFPWRELSGSMMTMPLDGRFKLMISTMVFIFFILISPAAALMVMQEKINTKTIPLLFIFLSFYTVVIIVIEVLVYYFYFNYIIVPSHDTSFTLLQFPLKEIGIFAFLIVLSSTYIFYKNMTPITMVEQSNEIVDEPKSMEKGQEANSKPTSLALSILSLQVIMWINIVIFIILTAFYLYGFTIDQELMMLSASMSGKVIGGIFGLFFALILFFTSRGLMNQKQWARVATLIMGVMMLFAFPVGTIVGIILIYGMTKGWQVEAVPIK
ncbi:MAG TPA: hypothetical protein VIM88_08675 [Sulfurovum sp.]|uniref:hypothetical protein n=1 Tax=Sulfurovum sp. TaxID=1969726 RepID=UPI002F91DF62